MCRLGCWLALSLVAVAAPSLPGQEDFTAAAQAFRKAGQPVAAASDTTLLCEAEEFQPQGKGWHAQPFGTNYYAATFANSFLSRKAYLGAAAQCDTAAATLEVEVPKAGKYLALVRYEAAYRFETQFKLVVEQNGKKLLDRLYGSRDNLRIWAFREKLKKEVAWPWGAGENVVWEGHDAFVELQPGKARLTLLAGKQPEPAARRNVDLVMLTSDLDQVKMRIDKENYLPLDGMLTQAGDVFVKVHNKSAGELKLTLPPCTEHSPYWVHIRTWKPKTIAAKPGETTDWVEVGSLLDTLSDGQWNLTAAGKDVHYELEFALKNAAGTLEPLRKFTGLTGNVSLAYDADTRYSRRIRLADDVLYDLVAYLKKHPVKGAPPKRTLIYGYTFAPKPADARYSAALEEFMKLMGATALGKNAVEDLSEQGLVRGYIDVRGVPTPKLEEYAKKLQAEGRADKIAVVSLGDEIGLPAPPAKDAGFTKWLQSQKLKPSDVDPAAGNDWDKVVYTPKFDPAKTPVPLYYYSKIYAFRFGIKALKERTDILRKYLPNAGIGANFSPHHHHLYLGDVYHWISVFREQGMTMPWGEDYIWQVPVGTQQMNFIMLDMFRAGIKPWASSAKAGANAGKIHYYVMPHTPGNTPSNWRRQFYGDLAHGAKVLNLFEFRPVQVAYTENHCSYPSMFQEVRKSIHELAGFEDIIQDGHVVPAQVGLWCSETADVWDDHRAPFDCGLRTLYIALRHLQLPVDFIVDGDDLKGLKTLVLTDRHVSRAGSQAIAKWVEAGGRLVATAGAGMFDEFKQPNKVLRGLLGVEEKGLEEDKEPIRFEKQDLPFAKPLAAVAWQAASVAVVDLPVMGVRAQVQAVSAKPLAFFKDNNQPAVVRTQVGKGAAYYCAFLPGLSYFKPALPKVPVDRGAVDDTLSHLLPRAFHNGTRLLLADLVQADRSIVCSAPLVETTLIQAKQGIVIPLINWTRTPLKNLEVTVRLSAAPRQASLATGGRLAMQPTKDMIRFTFDLDVADALILR